MTLEDQLQTALMGLYLCEDIIENIERQAEIFRLRRAQKLYQNRSKYIENIDKFWYIVLSQHEDFAEYVKPSEYRYFEYLKDLYVSWEVAEDYESGKVAEDDFSGDPGNFSITFVFDNEGRDDIIPSQTITKVFKARKVNEVNYEAVERKSQIGKSTNARFQAEKYTGQTTSGEASDFEETTLISERVDAKWPGQLVGASELVRKKSFFSFFDWSGNPEVNQTDRINGAINKNQKDCDFENDQKDFDYENSPRAFANSISTVSTVDLEDEDAKKLKYQESLLNVEELAILLAEDIFPHAVKYYSMTQQDQLEEELKDDQESEPELDITNLSRESQEFN